MFLESAKSAARLAILSDRPRTCLQCGEMIRHLTYTAGFAGGSRVKVRLKTWEQMDADFAAAEALASGKPGNIGSYFTGNRRAAQYLSCIHAYQIGLYQEMHAARRLLNST